MRGKKYASIQPFVTVKVDDPSSGSSGSRAALQAKPPLETIRISADTRKVAWRSRRMKAVGRVDVDGLRIV
jgi:hypothetical protein